MLLRHLFVWVEQMMPKNFIKGAGGRETSKTRQPSICEVECTHAYMTQGKRKVNEVLQSLYDAEKKCQQLIS